MYVSLTEREKTTLQRRAWKRAGKGKGNKWLMLRDVVVFCALHPWTTTELEDAMLLYRGLSHRKTYEMIQDLERSRALVSEKDPTIGVYWMATPLGVKLFTGAKVEDIPAFLVREVEAIASAKK